MEFIRLKYANNKLINADIKEHRDIIDEYVERKGYIYVGFIPVVFGPSGKILEIDLIFRKPVKRAVAPTHRIIAQPPKPLEPPKAKLPKSSTLPKQEVVQKKHEASRSNDLYNDHGLDLILNGGGDDLLGVGK